MCVCVSVCGCVELLICIHSLFQLLTASFPSQHLVLPTLFLLIESKCFYKERFVCFVLTIITMWVGREHRLMLERCMVVDKARALTENSNAPCIVRKEVRMSIQGAYELLKKCEIERLTVMQYGQKADFGNKVVKWALKNVRG